MKLAVITQIEHFQKSCCFYSYAPYVREMNLWFQYVDEIKIVAPLSQEEPGTIDLAYAKNEIDFVKVPAFSLTSVTEILKTLLVLPTIVKAIYSAMQAADHIHLRCPGNMGLLGAIVQIFFPKKNKTAKYAGNWDPNSKQPWSYRLQKWILGNTKLTKNMQVLVYGKWPDQSENIKPFFTASYTEADKTEIPNRKYDLPIRFLFVGSLVEGKRPLYALELIHELIIKGIPVEIHFYGDGPLRSLLEDYREENELKSSVFIHGNQNSEILKEAYQKSHFLILASKSEGWPKAIAEAMWWGVIPIATPVSCVPWMLGNESRGILLDAELDADTDKLKEILSNKNQLKKIADKASNWSRNYTLDFFETEIEKLL